MTTDTPPRRKWNITRWLLVFALVALGWSGWRAYVFRSALSQAKALGWAVEYTNTVEEIRADWKAAFEEATWLDGVTYVSVPTSEEFEQNVAIVHRLNPKFVRIYNAATLRDLSALKPLDRLQTVWLYGCTQLTNVDALENLSALQTVGLFGCTGLTNVDALKNLSALQSVVLRGCTGLTNVDALKNLSALQGVNLIDSTGLMNVDGLKNLSTLRTVYLEGCTGLTPDHVAALKAALPNAKITGP